MKRFVAFLMVLALLPLMAAPAFADILLEPQDNSFFDRHRNECVSEGRSYYANGKEGFVTLWDKPDGSRVIEQHENGKILSIPFLYRDWAMATRWEGREITGWVPMSDLSLVYDNISFREEYGDQIQPYNGEFANYDGSDDCINLYEYPGAPNIRQTWGKDSDWWFNCLDGLTGRDKNWSPISSVFVDEEGLTWGYVGYFYGRVSAWFCLDDPDGESFPVRPINQPELIPAQTPVPPSPSILGYLPYCLVGGVVLATILLLAVFYRKKHRNQA